MRSRRNYELPSCLQKVRKISYSTFSVIDVNDEGDAKIIEEGNPEFLWIKNNEVMTPSMNPFLQNFQKQMYEKL